ncbi:MAG: RtcB family protein [Candidatus Marsarchaeota archaeon]|nr:RtcB family protein [Candidatus Marsarchaeota archaeon]
MNVKRIDEIRFRIERQQGMSADVVGYASDALLEKIKKDHTLQQAANAATLPDPAGNILLMPDAHEGYGFPIGGVMAFDSENGIVSPGAIGFDINCGVRLIKTNLTEGDIRPKIIQLSDELFKNIPSGVGSRLNLGFGEGDLERVTQEGIEYLIKKGFGVPEDVAHTEENGRMIGADFSKVSKMAKSRGLTELGTLGAGNHFLEVQRVEKILDLKVAKAYGLHEGQVVVMVHTGSRGFGHQICSDYLRTLEEYQRRNSIALVDRELCYAKIQDREAQDYLSAMKCGVNFAFTNRHIITDSIRRSFEKVFERSWDSLGMEMLYDLSHNILKVEEHEVDGHRRKLLVHRKGATRAFAKGRPEIPQIYRDIGQPVLIPGSMGTASYVLCGREGSMRETFGSACHGAGRVMSRHQALRDIPASKTFESLKSKNIEIRIRTRKLVSEEAEWTYKDIDEVVGVVEKADLAVPVSRNVPIAVIKG